MEESCEFSAGTKGRMVRVENPAFGVRKLECCFDNHFKNNENNSNHHSGKGAPIYKELGPQHERNYP